MCEMSDVRKMSAKIEHVKKGAKNIKSGTYHSNIIKSVMRDRYIQLSSSKRYQIYHTRNIIVSKSYQS